LFFCGRCGQLPADAEERGAFEAGSDPAAENSTRKVSSAEHVTFSWARRILALVSETTRLRSRLVPGVTADDVRALDQKETLALIESRITAALRFTNSA